MRYVICDITGRTINYDFALSESIQKELGEDDRFELWIPGIKNENDWVRKLISIVPSHYRNSSSSFIRFLKVVDTFCAYVTIAFRMIALKPNVFHLQWFPFLSLGTRGASIDLTFIKLLKKLSPKSKLFYTIHNICPHSMMEDDRQYYNPVFSKALSLFDHFIVHTENTKLDVCQELKLNEDTVSVVYHGVFIPKTIAFDSPSLNHNEVRIIMYGNQNWYKGTDILVKSLSFLCDSIKNKLKVTICGSISADYLAECKSCETDLKVDWIPRFVDDEVLYDQINKADIIVLPYRRISQSGVLLLALATKRFIITSDLDNFKETLAGFPNDLFFKSEDPKDLARVISRYCRLDVNLGELESAISGLNELYSWRNSALSTLSVYNSVLYA